ncbi:hypothetical protein [Nonomuraea sp. 10N515B]|uniref:hypothetical protein n=1 Tax=Nonomuraea sp. 10N515B TaxID=3457422 RepID=UPI003FCEAE42
MSLDWNYSREREMPKNRELEELAERLNESPAARARFLAGTIELLEENGVDVSAKEFGGLLTADISNHASFLRSLAASAVVTAIGYTGGGDGGPQESATTVVIAIASGGAAEMQESATTVVVAIAVAGGAAAEMQESATTVVVAIAVAGGAGAELQESAGGEQLVLRLPSLEALGKFVDTLRQLADQLEAQQQKIGREISAASNVTAPQKEVGERKSTEPRPARPQQESLGPTWPAAFRRSTGELAPGPPKHDVLNGRGSPRWHGSRRAGYL